MILAHGNIMPNLKAQDGMTAMDNALPAIQDYQVLRIMSADKILFIDHGHPHVKFALAMRKGMLQKRAPILD